MSSNGRESVSRERRAMLERAAAIESDFTETHDTFPPPGWSVTRDMGSPGSFGHVFIGLDDKRQCVAIKELRVDDTNWRKIAVVEKEVQALLQALKFNNNACHPNVVCYKRHFIVVVPPPQNAPNDKGSTPPRSRSVAAARHRATVSASKRYFIVTDWVDGKPLDVAVNAARDFPKRLHTIVRTALRGLTFLHCVAHIAHRDIKPANVIVRNDTGESVLIDLGLSCFPHDAFTCTGFHGTEHYMTCERLEEEEDHDTQTSGDVWALGVSLYEALTKLRLADVVSNLVRVGGQNSEPPSMCDLQRARKKWPEFRRVISMDLTNANVQEWLCAVVTDMLTVSQTDRPEAATLLGRVDAVGPLV